MCARRNPAILLAIASIASVVFVTRAADAQPRQYRIEYRADSACPAESELVRQVEARVARASRVTGTGGDVGADVVIERRADGFHASIALLSVDGSVRRDVDGADCAGVVRAVALIVALALDPDAREATPAAPPAVPASPPPPAESTSKTDFTPAPPSQEAATFSLGGGALGGVMGGVAPTLALYEGGYVGLTITNAAAWSYGFRLAAFRSQRSTETSLGGLEMRLLALRASACPLRRGAQWFAEVCATFDAGSLRGRGYDAIEPQTQNSFWYGPGLSLGLGTSLFDMVSIGVEFGALAPLARDRFYFAPDLTAHRVPVMAGYVGLGLGLRT